MNMLAMGFFLSKYRCPNKRYDGHSVYTNTPPLGAMRGAGNPEIHFAVESQMDIIAAKLEIDPVELRLKNHSREGDTFIGQSIAISSKIQSCGTEELIREGSRRIGWENREARTPDPDRPWIKRGIGMASGFHTSGAGCPTPSVVMTDYSGAMVKMNEDGTANLTIAVADFGSGNRSAVTAIVAEELGIRYEDVILSRADTENSLYEFITHASRSVYSVGSAARAAAGEAKRALLDLASRMSEIPPERLEIADGRIFSKTDPSTGVSVTEVLGYAQSQNLGEPVGTASHRSTACPPHFVATFAEVDVDTLTGELKVVRVAHGGDPGTPIDVGSIRGQLIGGLHQGLGYALTEHLIYDSEDGRVLNPTFKDYKLLPPADMPTVETFLATTWEPTGPFGAKGIGEGCLNPVAPAVYNAVANAIGVRIFDMPLTPEKILHALKEKSDDNDEARPTE
jgi:CO/xanthine dehydrogenase Mo-binding subunit